MCWELVAAELKNPHDLNNLSNASHYFYLVLQRKRPQFLLQLVLPILGNFNSSTRCWRQDLSRRDLLSFRLANKSCNQSVQHYFQKHLYRARSFINESGPSSHYILGDGFDYHTFERWPPFICENISDYRVNSLSLSHPPAASYPNPVLSRKGSFSIAPHRSEVIYYEGRLSRTSRLLEAYGEHLWHCQFHLGGALPLQRQYGILRDWLQLLPNVQTLSVQFTEYFDPSHQPDMTLPEAFVEANPLPELIHLSKLRTISLPWLIQKEFFQRYRQVAVLYLKLPGNGHQIPSFPVQLDSISTLKIKLASEADLEALGRCITPSWLRLQTLEMDFSERININARVVLRWSQIISFLNETFGGGGWNGLVNLSLNMPYHHSSLEDSKNCRLKLGHAEQLKLHVNYSRFHVDFLLPMKSSLRKLAIQSHNDYDILPVNREVLGCREKIAWNGWMGKPLLGSNIWTNFPNLNYLWFGRTKGWTYRRLMGKIIYEDPNGKESSSEYEENIVEDAEEPKAAGDEED